MAALFLGHGGVELPVDTAQLVEVGGGPDAHGPARQHCRALGGGLDHPGAHHAGVEYVGLELHQEVVGAGPAVHQQDLGQRAGVGGHGGDDVRGLIGDGFQRGPHDVRPPGAPGEAHDGAAAVHVPVGRAQAGEGGHEVHVAVVADLRGHALGLGGAGHQAHLVPEPLHHRAAHEHAALQRVAGLAVDAPGHGGDQVLHGLHRRLARVHQHEAAGAVGVLAHARFKAALAEQRRVLVARHGGDGDLPAQYRLIQHADHAGGIHHPRQHLRRYVHGAQQHLVPLLGVDVVEHGAPGVGGVGDVHVVGGQVPRKEAVHRAEAQLALLRPLPRAGDGVQHPLQLRAREVGVRHQAGAVPEHVAQAVLFQPLHQRRGAAALPHDGVAQRLAGGPVPQERSLALVGDADGRDVLNVHAGLLHRDLQRGDLA